MGSSEKVIVTGILAILAWIFSMAFIGWTDEEVDTRHTCSCEHEPNDEGLTLSALREEVPEFLAVSGVSDFTDRLVVLEEMINNYMTDKELDDLNQGFLFAQPDMITIRLDRLSKLLKGD